MNLKVQQQTQDLPINTQSTTSLVQTSKLIHRRSILEKQIIKVNKALLSTKTKLKYSLKFRRDLPNLRSSLHNQLKQISVSLLLLGNPEDTNNGKNDR